MIVIDDTIIIVLFIFSIVLFNIIMIKLLLKSLYNILKLFINFKLILNIKITILYDLLFLEIKIFKVKYNIYNILTDLIYVIFMLYDNFFFLSKLYDKL